MNRPCPEMQDKIADYVLGALDTRQTEALQEHLAACEACRQYAQSLEKQAQALVALGRQVDTDMEARGDRVIEALQDVSPVQAGTRRLFPPVGGFLRMSIAAALVLGAGVILGRSVAPRPVDVEQLRADLQASIVASLKPAVQESVLAEMDRRLESGLAANEASLRGELAEQLRGDLQLFATQFTAGSEQRLDKRFAEFIQLIEEARLKDRQQVAKALEQIEHDRVRDKAQFGTGLQYVAALTAKATPAIQH
jgi:anti-sigma factor RsiW